MADRPAVLAWALGALAALLVLGSFGGVAMGGWWFPHMGWSAVLLLALVVGAALLLRPAPAPPLAPAEDRPARGPP